MLLGAVLSRDYETKVSKKKTIPDASFTMPRRPRERQPITTATSCQTGSGDGITSVFIPPTSPVPKQKELDTFPPVTRRARSATVAGGPSPAEINAANGDTAGGAWWKRMSVRLGGGWNAQDNASANS